MSKTTPVSTDELIAKYSTAEDGGFPFPALPEKASDELTAEIFKVRGAVRRKAQNALIDFVVDNAKDLELNVYQQKALAHLTAERARGRKGDGVGKSRVTKEEQVYNFFLDTDNHVDAEGNRTPGKVSAVSVFINLEMDPVRTLGAARRILDTREPAERLWISYDSKARAYSVAGPQEDAPEGWTGPVPAPKSADDLTAV